MSTKDKREKNFDQSDSYFSASLCASACDWTDCEERAAAEEIVMKKNNIHTLRHIHRKRGTSAIISNQDVIDIQLDFSLSHSPPPGSCHSRTLRLKSSRDRQLSSSFCLTRAYTLSLLKYDRTQAPSLSASWSLALKPNTHRCSLLLSALSEGWLFVSSHNNIFMSFKHFSSHLLYNHFNSL